MAYVQLGDICNVVKGEIGITKAIPGDYPMVTTGEFRKSHNKFQLDTKAVLVPLVSATGHGHASIKRIHYQEGKFSFGSILAACIPKDKAYSAKFLYIYFNLMKDLVLVPLMKGSANVSLTLGNLKTAKVPDISLEIQLKIVELYSEIKIEQDKATDLLIKQKDDIASLIQSILQEAVQGKLTVDWRKDNPDVEPASILLKRILADKEELIDNKVVKRPRGETEISKTEFQSNSPKEWRQIKLIDAGFTTKLAGFENTKHIRLKDSGEVPVIMARNIGMNRIKEKIVKYINLDVSLLLERSALTKPCILITSIGAGIGDVAVFDKKQRWHLAANTAKLELFNNLNANLNLQYVVFYLMSYTGQKEIFKSVTTTAQPSLSTKAIRNVILELPPLEEQKAIVKKVNDLMDLCNTLEQEVQKSQEDNEQLVQSVLREVFEGGKSI